MCCMPRPAVPVDQTYKMQASDGNDDGLDPVRRKLLNRLHKWADLYDRCNRARALAPWVLMVLVFGSHFLEAGVVRRLLEGWVSPPLEFNTYPFPFGTCLG